MTSDKFEALAFHHKYPTPLRWSIYMPEEEKLKGYDRMGEWDIDTRAPEGVDDGVYFVYYINPQHAAYGLTIEDGHFVLAPSIEAINKAVRRDLNRLYWGLNDHVFPGDNINHIFIEKFAAANKNISIEGLGTDKLVKVCMGS